MRWSWWCPDGLGYRPAQAQHYLDSSRLLDREGIEAFAAHMTTEPLPPVFQPYADAVNEARTAGYLAADPTSLAHVLRGPAASDLPPLDQLAGLVQPTLILAWRAIPATRCRRRSASRPRCPTRACTSPTG